MLLLTREPCDERFNQVAALWGAQARGSWRCCARRARWPRPQRCAGTSLAQYPAAHWAQRALGRLLLDQSDADGAVAALQVLQCCASLIRFRKHCFLSIARNCQCFSFSFFGIQERKGHLAGAAGVHPRRQLARTRLGGAGVRVSDARAPDGRAQGAPAPHRASH